MATGLTMGGALADDGLGTAKAPIELRIIANSAFSHTWQSVLVPEFNKIYPNIKVTIDGVPYNEHLAKLMLEATSASPEYDVLVIDDPWTPQLAQLGALVDLKGPKVAPITSKDYDWADFNAAPLAAGEWKGLQYSIPVRSNMLLMFYNRAHYKKAGLPEPTPALTWDQYFEQAPKLVQDMNGDGTIDAWAVDTFFVRDQLTPPIWQTIMNSNGGSLLDDKGAPVFNNEVGVAALNMHKKLLEYAPPGALGHGLQESLQAFRQGAVATMFMWGSVYKATGVDPKASKLTLNELGMQVMPVGKASAGAHRGIWTAGISAKTKRLNASWAFVEWLSSKQGEKTNVSLAGSFPARKSTLSAPAEDWQKPVFSTLQQAYDVAEKGKMWRIRSPRSDATQQILADEVARALAGQVSSKEALDVAANRIAKVLK
ncbi:MAG: sugar ABC transporter substrate-binding protein [Afipia sp.]|nr:sugar ABC transporter substrate-binding protein [Afipia sp.]